MIFVGALPWLQHMIILLKIHHKFTYIYENYSLIMNSYAYIIKMKQNDELSCF